MNKAGWIKGGECDGWKCIGYLLEVIPDELLRKAHTSDVLKAVPVSLPLIHPYSNFAKAMLIVKKVRPTASAAVLASRKRRNHANVKREKTNHTKQTY